MHIDQPRPIFSRPVLQRGDQNSFGLLRSNWSVLTTGTSLALLLVFVLAVVQFVTPDLAGNDGYYHIKLAQVMRQEGVRPSFPWLPLTILNPSSYYDHHFLYHVLLIPFTFGDLRQGAKWASVLFPALAFCTGWLLLRGQRVPFAALWTLGFVAVSEAFLYRMSMPRAQALSLLVLLLALHLAFTGRYRWLLPVGFLYVWLYNAFPLLFVVVGVYVAVQWLLERRLALAPLLYTTGGIGLGLVINPYFPENLVFIYNHLGPKLVDATAVKVGNEWYPYRTWTLVENSGPALLLLGTGVFALGLHSRKMNVSTATTLVLTLVFGLMLLKSRRFVEYWPAFALLFAALAWTPILRGWLRQRRLNQGLLAGLMLLLLLPAVWWTATGTQESLGKSKPYQQYASASAWLIQNTPAGSRIFQTDWDDFTRLFFYNSRNTYTAGLDPTYMQLHDSGLFDLWVNITKGRLEYPAETIATTFGAGYVITDLKHKAFLKKAEADPQLEEVFRDKYAVIFKVLVDQEER